MMTLLSALRVACLIIFLFAADETKQFDNLDKWKRHLAQL